MSKISKLTDGELPERPPIGGVSGTCGFCGQGDGWLGEQGDESTEYLHQAVREGDAPDWTYVAHPNRFDENHITWCGQCIGGLKHKWQRYDDNNLRAFIQGNGLRLALDGLRLGSWDAHDDEERAEVRKTADDVAVHGEKLRLERDLSQAQSEEMRRIRVRFGMKDAEDIPGYHA